MFLVFDTSEADNSLQPRISTGDPYFKDALLMRKYVVDMITDLREDGEDLQITQTETHLTSVKDSPQQISRLLDCGTMVLFIMDQIAQGMPIVSFENENKAKEAMIKYRAKIVNAFLNDNAKSWTLPKFEAIKNSGK